MALAERKYKVRSTKYEWHAVKREAARYFRLSPLRRSLTSGNCHLTTDLRQLTSDNFSSMHSKRIQLTLFVPENVSAAIEEIRSLYNPVQYNLIAAHVTLCREDELLDLEQLQSNLDQIDYPSISVRFGKPERFDKGKGVLLPALDESSSFQELRKAVLNGIIIQPRNHQPHITLMHPRNSTCTAEIMEEIRRKELPSAIAFDHIALIEQLNGGRWKLIRKYPLKS